MGIFSILFRDNIGKAGHPTLLVQLFAGRDPHELFAKDGLLYELKKAFLERMLDAELTDHLDCEAQKSKANRRNGTSQKTMG